MATKAVNFKIEESKIAEAKDIASVFHMTLTEVLTEALNEYITRMRQDPFYKLTANVEDASSEENLEVLESIEALSDEDLQISSCRKYTIH